MSKALRLPSKKGWAALAAALALLLGLITATQSVSASAAPTHPSIKVTGTSAKTPAPSVTSSKVFVPSLSSLTDMNGRVVITTKAAAFAHAAALGIPIYNGPGLTIDGHFFGAYKEYYGGMWHLLYCVTPLKGLNRGQALSPTAVLASIGALRSHEIEYILYYHGNAWGQPHHAAAVSIALNKIVGNAASEVNTWLKFANPADVALANSHIRYAAAYHCPCVLRTATESQVIIGQPTTAVAHLLSATSRGLPGRRVYFSYVNGAGTASAVTGPHGFAFAKYWPTTVLPVGVTAKVVNAAPAAMLVSQPGSYDQQTLLSPMPGVTLQKSFSYHQHLSPSKPSYNCGTNCTGKPPVKVTVCNPAWAAEAVHVFSANGKAVLTVVLPKSSRLSCRSASFIGYNREAVSESVYFVRADHSKTVAVHVGGFVIDCPPALTFTVAQRLFCTCQAIAIASGVNHGSKPVTVSYRDSAGNHATYSIASGRSLATKSFHMNASRVSWELTESIPYATHSGSRAIHASGTVAVS